VESAQAAVFSHDRETAADGHVEERVRLQSGTLTLAVKPLATGERFRVVVGEDEVEVRGTRFLVHAENHRLIRVEVFEGLVDVRRKAREPIALQAGKAWLDPATPPAPPATDPPAPRPSPRPAPRKVRVTTDVEPPAPPVAAMTEEVLIEEDPAGELEPDPITFRASTPAELAFERGVQTLDKERYKEAVDAFREALVAEPNGALAEDALFWQAVSLAKAGEDARARPLFTEFVRRFPHSARRGEAFVVLGWSFYGAGHYREAGSWFEKAEHDPRPAVRASAQKGLAALPKH
jgi:TolA-binding protein